MSRLLKFLNHRIEEYALMVTYDPEKEAGEILYNLSLIREEDRDAIIATLHDSYSTGLCVSDRVRFVEAGDSVGGIKIPGDELGICTMCSITLDALLIRRGVPLRPIGGGVVEIVDRIPRRFTDIIRYESTTIDPIQVLLSQEVTDITRVMTRGDGAILANMRECHMESEFVVSATLEELTDAGFTGILEVGVPNVPLLGVPVRPEYFGIALVGGTNPIAAFKEQGGQARTVALKGLMDIGEMVYIADL